MTTPVPIAMSLRGSVNQLIRLSVRSMRFYCSTNTVHARSTITVHTHSTNTVHARSTITVHAQC